VTPQPACQSGLFRRLGRTRATGRLRGRDDLVQPAQRAQRVRPSVSALLVLPYEVRRASKEHQVEASAEGKTRGSRYAGRHRGSPIHRYGGAIGGDRREPTPSSVTPSRLIDCKAWVAAPPVPTQVAGQPHSARIRRSRTTTQVGVSHSARRVLDPDSIGLGIAEMAIDPTGPRSPTVNVRCTWIREPPFWSALPARRVFVLTAPNCNSAHGVVVALGEAILMAVTSAASA
jgi:hypothetical protein